MAPNSANPRENLRLPGTNSACTPHFLHMLWNWFLLMIIIKEYTHAMLRLVWNQCHVAQLVVEKTVGPNKNAILVCSDLSLNLYYIICPTKEVLGVGLEIIMPYCQVVQHVCLVCYTGQGGMSILWALT